VLPRPHPSGPRLDIRSRLALATLPAATVVLLDELVLWAGRPVGDPTARMVADSYRARAAEVLLGDALWLAALGVLVAVLWTAAASFPTRPRWIVRTVGLLATTAFSVSGLLGARLALGLPNDALSEWRLEGATYRVGAILLALTLAAYLFGLGATRRRALVPPLALMGVAVAVPATTAFGIAAALPLLAFALLPTRLGPSSGASDIASDLVSDLASDRVTDGASDRAASPSLFHAEHSPR
jgi:hypothetical protein